MKNNEMNSRTLSKMSLVRQGIDLNELIADGEIPVRAEVANQGYGLDKLIDDEKYTNLEFGSYTYSAKSFSNYKLIGC